ncbi:MAG: transporter substrate-binding domain-containing protein [Gammaproteobacteria bacterium]|nr:transporter substrate-binding domain-containing protein [Gammaproteobacteria bacterium]MBU1554411.1 transporter substrate-binding domain-containing protein [Gammaproteobacteria bacterium]MBU2070564.1 transporter substrate-binding domain-containing protein [Gammaproteobacteria bacterium]MBU2185376.1 transporter substrate-binding domain-containing protein [Gammaproteobacteria bacterium]MBU2207070.1 transporter substrate-binding domain-containing protein [Gammaproteobacteria bacterium]
MDNLYELVPLRTPLIQQLLICLLLLAVAVLKTAAATEPQATTPVYYPGHPRQDYYVELLQLALSYPCAAQYQLQASGLDLPKKRAFDLMNAKAGIDIMYGSASAERLEHYQAVPFPILRGLMGLRIALVSDKSKLSQIHSVAALAKLRVGQYISWSDTAILQANRFNVEPVSDVEGLYKMLALGRLDYFPRSVLEVLQNQAEHAELNLQIDPHILLYYPTATYYYVAKDNSGLAEALLCGLEQAQNDGSLSQQFERYYGGLLQQLNVKQRRVFNLQNPLLPADVPLQRQELWYELPNNKVPQHE